MQLRGGHAVRAASVGCALVLSACAGWAPERPLSAEALAATRPSFEVAGRLSIRHRGDALTANFNWRHDGADDELHLATPLGQTIARLAGGREGVTLQMADGRVTAAADWAGLSVATVEWSLPVDGLAFWIQGAPRPQVAFDIETAADGTPRLLRQEGWTIFYQAFASDPAGRQRPARMTLSYPDLEIRLVVDRWL
jgi:outer membrane lipoprotein LolB